MIGKDVMRELFKDSNIYFPGVRTSQNKSCSYRLFAFVNDLNYFNHQPTFDAKTVFEYDKILSYVMISLVNFKTT
ncbi:hypothetical protein BSG1_13666 [Bacillus sp. SG-1]|nr:hypothetical protein BSG1_13666 [Bacillus sp. SG-1]